ncbi:uncharacterized protein MONOS_1447 [Monocercomonoides exilis]|uniref:uncharacterized protein n=1 Tax=Monocercomonoides exilis TaxID=2049356 RepID=UPI003559BCE9|nr:hypothetical protein MONOS_1447 [Monocercomonoides exilis]|eukprot:MONOS_1447.1-p1 / transcript=MONOS_1447.1 / gene=MONOS_1447 / organism=Monocercomonoides_exilis_PA203 / gene_product=unspecified product / transcript_product=unspecified product / location=Mono_scaffold00025:216188-217561(+) / protein_length=407 / sequence_SO=supercontig / SO=protein_coding / is_pseudo=false
MLKQSPQEVLLTAMSSYIFIFCFITINIYWMLAMHSQGGSRSVVFVTFGLCIVFVLIIPLCIIIPMFPIAFTKYQGACDGACDTLHLIEGTYAAILNTVVALIILVYGIRIVGRLNKAIGISFLSNMKRGVLFRALLCLCGFIFRAFMLVLRYVTDFKHPENHAIYTFLNALIGQVVLALMMLVMIGRWGNCCCCSNGQSKPVNREQTNSNATRSKKLLNSMNSDVSENGMENDMKQKTTLKMTKGEKSIRKMDLNKFKQDVSEEFDRTGQSGGYKSGNENIPKSLQNKKSINSSQTCLMQPLLENESFHDSEYSSKSGKWTEDEFSSPFTQLTFNTKNESEGFDCEQAAERSYLLNECAPFVSSDCCSAEKAVLHDDCAGMFDGSNEEDTDFEMCFAVEPDEGCD